MLASEHQKSGGLSSPPKPPLSRSPFQRQLHMRQPSGQADINVKGRPKAGRATFSGAVQGWPPPPQPPPAEQHSRGHIYSIVNIFVVPSVVHSILVRRLRHHSSCASHYGQLLVKDLACIERVPGVQMLASEHQKSGGLSGPPRPPLSRSPFQRQLHMRQPSGQADTTLKGRPKTGRATLPWLFKAAHRRPSHHRPSSHLGGTNTQMCTI